MTQKTKRLTLKASQTMGGHIKQPVTFAMVDMAAIEGISDLIHTAPNAARLLMTLIRHMSPGSGGVVVCSRETMRELLDCSMPTIERALRTLIGGQFVHRVKIGSAYALAINDRVAWVGPRGDIQHAVFSATVIASRSEQDAVGLNPGKLRPVPVIASDEHAIAGGDGLPPPSQPELDGLPPAVIQRGER